MNNGPIGFHVEKVRSHGKFGVCEQWAVIKTVYVCNGRPFNTDYVISRHNTKSSAEKALNKLRSQ